MREEKPLLSIHVSVFNLENYIEKCLVSILNQSFDDYELLLIDNGSTDKSIEICEMYSQKYPDRINFIKLPLPTVIGRPYNYAMSHMKGEYFMCIDGDDYIIDGCLSKIANVIKSKNPDLISGTFIYETEPGVAPFKDAIIDTDILNKSSYKEIISYIINTPSYHFVQWRFIASKALLNYNNNDFNNDLLLNDLKNASHSGDTISVIKLLNNANSIYFLSDPFYVYRCRKGSLSSNPFYNDKAIGYMAILILMEYYLDKCLIKKEMTNDLIKAQINKFYYFYIFLSHTISDKGYLLLADLIDRYSEYFYKLKRYNLSILDDLFINIEDNGTLKGLKLFSKDKDLKLLEKQNKLSYKNLYIFPAGVCSESTALLLKNIGIEVDGFLDNNKDKSNMLFQNIPCYKPDVLLEMPVEERREVMIIISVLYDNLIPVLVRQLEKLGIENNQIIIRNYL